MRFRAHETFSIRKGWINKGMKNVKRKPDVFVDKDEKPMDVLGIGSSMVKALRYWLKALELTEEPRSGKRIQTFTEFGNSIFYNDRYIEETGTLLLLHYKLACNKAEVTAWYYLFNEFNMTEFTKDDFVQGLKNYVMINGEDVALRSINDDFDCIVNTYISRYITKNVKMSPESNIECPLGELGLLDILDGDDKIYRKSTPNIKIIDSWIILAIIMDQRNGKNTIALNELLTSPCNIGRILNLDSISMLELLHEVEKSGAIKIVRTAGLDIIQINKDYSFQDCVNKYYKDLVERN